MVQTTTTITFTNLIQSLPLGADFIGGGILATASGKLSAN